MIDKKKLVEYLDTLVIECVNDAGNLSELKAKVVNGDFSLSKDGITAIKKEFAAVRLSYGDCIIGSWGDGNPAALRDGFSFVALEKAIENLND